MQPGVGKANLGLRSHLHTGYRDARMAPRWTVTSCERRVLMIPECEPIRARRGLVLRSVILTIVGVLATASFWSASASLPSTANNTSPESAAALPTAACPAGTHPWLSA